MPNTAVFNLNAGERVQVLCRVGEELARAPVGARAQRHERARQTLELRLRERGREVAAHAGDIPTYIL